MLRVTGITKSYGGALLLDHLNFTISRGEKVGLIGSNGTGKSTLLKIIANREQPDRGSVWLEPSVRAGYLAQSLAYEAGDTLDDVVTRVLGPSLQILAEIERLSEEITRAGAQEFDAVMAQYSAALDEAERLDAYSVQARVAEYLAGLDLASLEGSTPVSTLSGGQKTRLGLACLLLTSPDLLLLDEPTNHLDLNALSWLQDLISHYKGTVLLVSHDRAFLDATVTKILALDETTHTLQEFTGNYSDYAAEIERQQARVLEEYYRQQERINRIESDIRQIKQRAVNTELATINYWIRKKAWKGARTAKVRERKLEKLLSSEEKIEKPKQGWHMKLDFVDQGSGSHHVLSLDNVSKSFDERCLFSGVTAEIQRGERVALLGPNGCGKTTLLRLISGQLKPDTGYIHLGASIKTGYLSQEQEGLNPDLTVLEVVRRASEVSETDARNFLHFFLFSGDEVFRQAGRLSFGERSRLALACLVLSGVNFLLLDEPLNHLDINSRQKFEQALENFEGAILAVVHDRYFVERFAGKIWSIEEEKLKIL